MADRYFPNELPDYRPDSAPMEVSGSGKAKKDSLTKLLHLPYTSLSERLKNAALDIKQKVFHIYASFALSDKVPVLEILKICSITGLSLFFQ